MNKDDAELLTAHGNDLKILPTVGRGLQSVVERREHMEPDVARKLLHELRLHQIEVEAQNSELRRTKMELDTARARYFDLYDLAPVGYCTVNDTEKILDANGTAAQLLGVAMEDLVGKPIQQFIASADQDIYYLHCKKLFETGKPQSCELRLLRPDRTLFWAQLLATFAPGATGNNTHRIVLTDIDERKLAQDKIRISDLALKAISQGVLITTPEFMVVSVNQAFVDMTGYSALDLAGVNCSIFNGPLTDTTVLNRFLASSGARKEYSGEIVNYRKDGSSFYNALTVTPVFDGVGNLTHFISINTDISERKRWDQDLLENNRALERATSAAEKANSAKSDFLSSMSHELRSPLNSILGFAQLLASGTPPPTALQRKNIDKILRGGWYLLTLINDILDLALIESGKLALTMVPLSLNQVLADSQNLIEAQAASRSIHVSFPVASIPWVVIADPVRLTQVIVNLLSNAIKYNRPHGSVQVSLRSNSQGTLRISVEDTGEGLPAEKLAQLFQPFNRLGQESTTTEGTGIGLVVTKRLIELMGGTIGVSSTVGVGSVFWVELKLAHSLPCAPSADSAGAQVPIAQDMLDQSPCTVLYVEDNAVNVELVEQILEGRANLRLLRAQDGNEGIAMARLHQPQIILMDIHLPGISGLEALNILRADPLTRHIPVLAVSANALPLDIDRGLAAGFLQYLTKPFKVSEFLRAIDAALDFSRSQSDR